MEPLFFKEQKELRKWFEMNYNKEKELLIGFLRKSTNMKSIDYQMALDEALCFGWIDSIRRSIDEKSFTIRFTPRKPDSLWSQVNVNRVHELNEKMLMYKAGMDAFKNRDEEKTKAHTLERENIKLEAAYEKIFKKNKKAWESFEKMPKSYQKPAIFWVESAKLEETKLKRLKELIEDSEKGERIRPLRWLKKS